MEQLLAHPPDWLTSLVTFASTNLVTWWLAKPKQKQDDFKLITEQWKEINTALQQQIDLLEDKVKKLSEEIDHLRGENESLRNTITQYRKFNP